MCQVIAAVLVARQRRHSRGRFARDQAPLGQRTTRKIPAALLDFAVHRRRRNAFAAPEHQIP